MLAAKVQKTSEMYSFYEQNTRAGKACPRGSPRDTFRYDLFVTFKDVKITEELWASRYEKYKAAFPEDGYNKWAALKKSVAKLIEIWADLKQDDRDEMSASVHSANGSSFAAPFFGGKENIPPTQTLEQLVGKKRGRPVGTKSTKSATLPNKRRKIEEEEVKDDLTDLSYASDWESKALKVPNKTGEPVATMAAFRKSMRGSSLGFDPRKLAAPITEKNEAKAAEKEKAFNHEAFVKLQDKTACQAFEIRTLKYNLEETQEKLRAEATRNQLLSDKVFELDQKLDAIHKVFWAKHTVAGPASRDLRMPLGGLHLYQLPIDGEYHSLARYGTPARATQERAKFAEEIKQVLLKPHKADPIQAQV